MSADATHTPGWVATLSDGTVATEHQGDYKIIEGAPKPWARLCAYLGQNKLHITSLRYNANGKTYHLPRADVRWNKGGQHPEYYAVEHVMEREESNDGVSVSEFVDVMACYANFTTNIIIEIGGEQMTWMEVRPGFQPMRPALARKRNDEQITETQ